MALVIDRKGGREKKRKRLSVFHRTTIFIRFTSAFECLFDVKAGTRWRYGGGVTGKFVDIKFGLDMRAVLSCVLKNVIPIDHQYLIWCRHYVYLTFMGCVNGRWVFYFSIGGLFLRTVLWTYLQNVFFQYLNVPFLKTINKKNMRTTLF